MATVPAKVIGDGRVTIPVEVREEHNLSDGDYVILEVEPFDATEEGDEPESP